MAPTLFISDLHLAPERPRLIEAFHAFTRGPARHEHVVDSRSCERYVLADWYDAGSYLRVDASGCRSIALG